MQKSSLVKIVGVFIALALTMMNSSAISLAKPLQAPPINDDLAEAIDVTAQLPFNEMVDVSEATQETNELQCANPEDGEDPTSVWYKISPTEAGKLTVTVTPATGVDPTVGLFSGTGAHPLTEIRCVDEGGDQAETVPETDLTANTSYWVRVAGFGEDVGALAVEINFTVSDEPTNPYKTDEYNLAWGLNAIKAAEAYLYLDQNGISKRGEGAILSVSDSGVDFSHLDLDGNKNPTGHSTIDGKTDGSGYVDAHGTHVAGVAAAEKDDAGMHGVAYNTNIIATNEEFDQVEYAANQGAHVINMSWSDCATNADPCSTEQLDTYRNHIQAASEKGVVLVTTLSNGSNDAPDDDRHGYPVAFANEVDGRMLVVGAIDENNAMASTSCDYSPDAQIEYCLVAPGKGILAPASEVTKPADGQKITHDGRDYFNWDGTSMAAPFVAGAATLIRSIRPELSAKQVVQILLDTATPLHAPGEDTSKVSPTYGHGLLNLEAAVKQALETEQSSTYLYLPIIVNDR